MKAKEVAIDALLKEDSLTTNEIYEKVKKSNIKLGYHSIYKALQQMKSDSIVDKKGNSYFLSQKWIKEQINFADKLKEHDTKNQNINNYDTHLTEFKNIKALYKFLVKVEEDHLKLYDKNKVNVIWVVTHLYNYLLEPAKKLAYIQKLKENNVNLNILCNGNTMLDIWTQKKLKKFGIDMKINSCVGGFSNLYIYDDIAIEAFLSKKFMNVLNDLYQNTKNIEDLDITVFFEKLNKADLKINAAIYTKESVIETLRERALFFMESK